jgi:hypothetical protein
VLRMWQQAYAAWGPWQGASQNYMAVHIVERPWNKEPLFQTVQAVPQMAKSTKGPQATDTQLAVDTTCNLGTAITTHTENDHSRNHMV